MDDAEFVAARALVSPADGLSIDDAVTTFTTALRTSFDQTRLTCDTGLRVAIFAALEAQLPEVFGRENLRHRVDTDKLLDEVSRAFSSDKSHRRSGGSADF